MIAHCPKVYRSRKACFTPLAETDRKFDFYHQKPSPRGGTANSRGKEFPLSVLAMLCEVAACQTAKYRSIWQLARTVPMPTCVGDDLMIRSLPGTCRCRRRSVAGTGRLGPESRWSCPSRRQPDQVFSCSQGLVRYTLVFACAPRLLPAFFGSFKLTSVRIIRVGRRHVFDPCFLALWNRITCGEFRRFSNSVSSGMQKLRMTVQCSVSSKCCFAAMNRQFEINL